MKTHKPTFSISLWFLASFFVLTSCVEPGNNDEPPQNDDPPKQLISVERAKDFYDTYSERRVRPIQDYEAGVDSATKFQATRYIEYDFETIKQYIAYLESEAKLADARVGKLRFYLTNYPNAEAFPNGDKVRYPRKNSVMVVPTTNIDGKQRGFVTRVTAEDKREIVAIRDLVRDRKPNQQQQRGGGGEGTQQSAVFSNPKFLFINPIFVSNAQGGFNNTVLNDGHNAPPPAGDDFED